MEPRTPAKVDGAASPSKATPAASVFAQSLPKGGGAIRGLGEKATHDLATGAARFSIPVFTSPGRSGSEPKLALSYDAGSGNSAFGLGFQLDLLAVSRRTDRGVPTYDDERDTFLLGGDELVPTPTTDAPHRYQPRREGAFIRIERIRASDGAWAWRLIDRNNTRTFLGSTPRSRECDPADPSRIAMWLVDRIEDDHGNVTTIEYKHENDANIPATAFEHRREVARAYPKRIFYGNRTAVPLDGAYTDWCFELVFDYGEHGSDAIPDELDESTWATPEEKRPWTYRPDPFSSHRFAFDRRTRRLCRRILMFHRFGSAPQLVRSTELEHDQRADFSKLVRARMVGYASSTATTPSERLASPAVVIDYTQARMATAQLIEPRDAEGMAAGLDRKRFAWVDLDGEGLAGPLALEGGALLYQRNRGGGSFAPPVRLTDAPSIGHSPPRVADFDGSGTTQLVSFEKGLEGFTERSGDSFGAFRFFESVPSILSDSSTQLVDLDGDGLPDVLALEDGAIQWFPSLGKRGFGPPVRISIPDDAEVGPSLAFNDESHSLFFADMSGDGLADIVCIRNGETFYWPGLGRGRFAPKVRMTNAPLFDHPDSFDPLRVRLADLDGSGTTDILYLADDEVRFWINQSGNGFADSATMPVPPSTPSAVHVDVFDLLGEGTSCLVWSSPLPDDPPLRYMRLFAEGKPHLLESVANGLGATTFYEHLPSTHFYLEDARQGRPWLTRLPFVVHVVSKIIVEDAIARTRLTSSFAYHHGFFDGVEREFRGFAMVEQTDAEDVAPNDTRARHLPPVLTRSWLHTGAFLERRELATELALEYHVDPDATPMPPSSLRGEAGPADERDALRALRGLPLRREVYSTLEHPISVAEWSYELVPVQLRSDERPGVWLPLEVESREHHYEAQANDPRTKRTLNLRFDHYGTVRDKVTIAEPRRGAGIAEQKKRFVIYETSDVAHRESDEDRRIGVPLGSETFHVIGLDGIADASLLATIETLPRVGFEDATLPPGTARLERIHESYVLYHDDDLSDVPLPRRTIGKRAIPYRTYALAFTEALRESAFGANVTPSILRDEGGYVGPDDEGRWFAPSLRVVPDADRFFLPRRELDPFGRGPTATYDEPNKLFLEAVVDERSNTTHFDLDERTLAPRKVTDANQNAEEALFDALGRVTKIVHRGRNGEGSSLAMPTKEIAYDSLRWEREKKPTYVRTKERRDYGAADMHEAVTYTDGSGREAMRKVRVRAEPSSGEARWVGTARTIFDNKGNPVEKFEPYFSSTDDYEDDPATVEKGVSAKLTYDPLSRLVRTDYPDGALERVSFTPWNEEHWDQNDTLLESAWFAEANSSGIAARTRAAEITKGHAETPVRKVLDSLGRVVGVDVQTVRNGPILSTVTSFDVMGNVRATIDPRSCTTYQTFDHAGHLIKRVSPDAGTTQTLTSALGEVVRQVSALGFILRTTYDVLRRPQTLWITDQGGTESLTERVVYGEDLDIDEALTRNALGRKVAAFDAAGMTTVDYDFRGRSTRETRSFAKAPEGATVWNVLDGAVTHAAHMAAAAPFLDETFAATTSFDAMDRVVSHRHHDGTTITHTYDLGGAIVGIDGLLPGATTAKPFVTDITYDPKGRRSTIVYGNGVQTRLGYDERNFRLTSVSTVSATQTLQLAAYTYDPVGNVVALRDSPLYEAPNVNDERLFTYDALYRLTTASGREHVSKVGFADGPHSAWVKPNPSDLQKLCDYDETYAYDESGNLFELRHTSNTPTNKVTWVRALDVHVDSNKLKSVSATGELSAPIEYEKTSGNVRSMPGVGMMHWDARDRLVSVDLGGGGTARYVYDAAGMRVRKIVTDQTGSTRRETLYVGGYEVFRNSDGSGKRFAKKTVHVMDGDRRIAQIATTTNDEGVDLNDVVERFILADHLESTKVETDEAGVVISYEEYYPYGGTSVGADEGVAGKSLKKYRFNGKERDDETGLYYFGARYYASWWGRWVSADPVERTGSAFVAMKCNPIRFLDPHGRDDVDSFSPLPSFLDGPLEAAADAIVAGEDSAPGRRLRGGRDLSLVDKAERWSAQGSLAVVGIGTAIGLVIFPQWGLAAARASPALAYTSNIYTTAGIAVASRFPGSFNFALGAGASFLGISGPGHYAANAKLMNMLGQLKPLVNPRWYTIALGQFKDDSYRLVISGGRFFRYNGKNVKGLGPLIAKAEELGIELWESGVSVRNIYNAAGQLVQNAAHAEPQLLSMPGLVRYAASNLRCGMCQSLGSWTIPFLSGDRN